MPLALNYALHDVQQAHWKPAVESPHGAILIHILDPDMVVPYPAYPFISRHVFYFLDLDYDSGLLPHPLAIQSDQAQALSILLQQTLSQQQDLVVHCHAGVCRSGAVVEAALALGFSDGHLYRSPNRAVKHALLQALGLPFDPLEPFTRNGIPFDYDEWNNPILRSSPPPRS